MRDFHGNAPQAADLSDQNLMSWSDDGRIRGWDVRTGKLVFHAIHVPTDASGPRSISITKLPPDPVKIQQIQIASAGPDVAQNEDLITFGWGKTRATSDFEPSALMRMLSLKPLSWAECIALRNVSESAIDLNAFCAKGPGRKTCRGDSGGPVLLGDTLIGIVSRGSGLCLDDGKPTTFTKVANYRPWVQSIVCENTSNRIQPSQETGELEYDPLCWDYKPGENVSGTTQ